MKEEDINWDALVDEILETYKQEYPEDYEADKNNYWHPDEDSINISILEDSEQNIDLEWVKKHPDLKKWVEQNFNEYLLDELGCDEELKKAWLEGYEYPRINFRRGFVTDIMENALDTYRKRVTKTYNCAKCGRMVSLKTEKGLFSLQRYGEPKPDKKDEHNLVILCGDCWKARFLPKR